MFNTTNRTLRFLFEDNCNLSKNPSSGIHTPFPKRYLTNYLKKIILVMFLSLEYRQETIKRISLNTRTLIVVFNEILIPQDSFSKTTVTRQRIRRRKFPIILQNIFIKTFLSFLYFFVKFRY